MEEYSLEIGKAVEKIRSSKAKRVLLQLPDGLKPKAKEIVDDIMLGTNGVSVDIWAGSCFGSCDLPNIKDKDYDILIAWGHSEWI